MTSNRNLRRAALIPLALFISALGALPVHGTATSPYSVLQQGSATAPELLMDTRNGHVYRIFKDMYFHTTRSSLTGNLRAATLRYTFTGTAPSILPGDLVWHGTYGHRIKTYRVQSATMLSGTMVVRGRSLTIAEIKGGGASYRYHTGGITPLYTKHMDAHGHEIVAYTTDAAYYQLAHAADPNLHLIPSAASQINPLAGASSGTMDVSYSISPFDLANGDPNLSIMIQGSLSYAPTLDIGYTGDAGSLTEAHATLSGYADLRAYATVTAYASFSGITKSADVAWFSYTFPAGPIAVTATAALTVDGSFQASMSGTVEAGAEVTVSHVQGISWDSTNGWQTTNSVTPAASLYNPDAPDGQSPTSSADAAVSFQIGVGPKFSVGVDGNLLALSINPKVEWNSSVSAMSTGNPCTADGTGYQWEVDQCYEVPVSLDLSPFNMINVTLWQGELYGPSCSVIASAGNETCYY